MAQALAVIADERKEIEARIQRDAEQREMVKEYMIAPAEQQLASIFERLSDFPAQVRAYGWRPVSRLAIIGKVA